MSWSQSSCDGSAEGTELKEGTGDLVPGGGGPLFARGTKVGDCVRPFFAVGGFAPFVLTGLVGVGGLFFLRVGVIVGVNVGSTVVDVSIGATDFPFWHSLQAQTENFGLK